MDTCAISELTKKKPKRSVVEWIESHDEQTLFLSVLTLGELEKGIAKLADSRRKANLQSWLQSDLHERFEGRVLDVTRDVAEIWGRLMGKAEKRGEVLPVIDSLIAATALAHDLAVVTRDNTDMGRCGVTVVNPWGQEPRLP